MKTIFTIFLFFIINLSFGQHWLETGGGASHDEAYDVEVDAAGNIYTTGYVTSSSVMGTSINIQTNGFSDIYVSKSSPSGTFLWAKTFGGASADRGYDIDVDNLGNIYVTGYVTGTVFFDEISVTTNNNSQDFFVAKLNPNGDVLWVNVEGGNDGESGFGIAVDSQSNVVVTGQFKGTATIGNAQVSSTYNPDEDELSTDIFIVKYDANGSPLWTRAGAAIYDDRGLAVDINTNDEILLTGQFSDTLTIAGQTFDNQIINAGYLLKMDQSGNNLWFRTLGAYQTMVYDVEVDNERVYITGDFLGQMAIQGALTPSFLSSDYQYKVFVVRFDQEGEVEWTEVDGSESPVSSKAIAFDSNRDVYIAGTFKCQFSEYADTLGASGYFNSIGYQDVFISKYAQEDGDLIWMRQYGGARNDYCSGIAVSEIDNPVIAGSYENSFQVPFTLDSFESNSSNYYDNSTTCDPNLHIVSLHSDGFKDIFITKPVDLNAPHMYYYTTNCYNSVLPELQNGADTISFCESGNLYVSTYTTGNGLDNIGHAGPYFSFEWNTGGTSGGINVDTSGWYSCQIDRMDGCSSAFDSIFVQVNPNPEIPPLTDGFGVNIQATSYQDLAGCYPDSVWAFFEVDTMVGTFLNGTPITNDTIMLTGGNYVLSVMTEFECYAIEDFVFELSYPGIDTMVPYLVHPSGLDSVTICQGESVLLNCLDSLSNPTLNPSIPFNTNVYPGNNGDLTTSIYPNSTGWYEVNYTPTLGYNNTCGDVSQTYNVSTQIHVTVNPIPTGNVYVDGITFFCPGDVTNVWTNTTYPEFSWSGPGIIEINATGDTITATQEGNYTYGGTLVDSITGCSSNVSDSFELSYKADPNIWSDTPDNLICPGDSILLTCDSGLEYTWVGPLGQIIGDSQSIWVDLPGFYHCVFVDFEGCLLTSNSLELLEYNSPYLIAEPGQELCHTGAIDVTILHSGSPDFSWSPPINSTADEVTIEEAGTYSCEITQCGVTITETITIEDSGFQAYIATSDTLLCSGDEFVLTANEGMAVYEWSNGTATFSNQLIVSEPGTYDVLVTSTNGCTSQSESITVEYYDYWQTPIVESVIICDSTSATLAVTGTGVFTWYDSTMTNIIAVADTFVTPILNNSISYFVVASDSLCSSDPIEVSVEIDNASSTPIIQGSGSYCEGESIVLSSSNEGEYLWILPDSTTDTSNPLIIENSNVSNAGMYTLQTTSGNCMSPMVTYQIAIEAMPSVELVYQDSVLCQDSLMLAVTGNYSNIQWLFDNEVVNDEDSIYWGSLIGNYSVIVENESGTCFASDQVYLGNDSTLSPPQLADQSICAGQSLDLFLDFENPYWATDNQLSDIQFSDTLITGVLMEDAVFYVGQMSNQGCYSAPTILNVEVFSTPAPVITYNEPICEGEDLVLSTNLPGAMIEWSLPDNTTINEQELIITNANQYDAGEYTAIAINNECVTEIGFVEVTINPIPETPTILGDLAYCEGDEVILVYQNFIADSGSYWMVEGVILSDSIFTMPSISSSFVIDATYSDGICSSTIQLDVTMMNNPNIGNIYTNSPVCEGDVLTLSTDSVGGNSYLWEGPFNYYNPSSEISISSAGINHDGEYSLQVIDANNCSAQGSIVIQVLQYPVIELGEDTIICPGVPIVLEVDNSYDSYLWSTGDFSNSLLVESEGIYSLQVANGPCWVTDEIEILEDCQPVFAPNIITPNGDNLNDRLYFNSPMILTLHVMVYNRWGNVVGEWEGLSGSWDGTHYLTGDNLAEGSYYYIIDYVDITGENHVLKSYITLLR